MRSKASKGKEKYAKLPFFFKGIPSSHRIQAKGKGIESVLLFVSFKSKGQQEDLNKLGCTSLWFYRVKPKRSLYSYRVNK